MRRRDALAVLLGGMGAAVAAARAESRDVPVVGILDARTAIPELLTELRQGLADAGYREGQNLTVEFKGAGGYYERIPVLAAELVRDRVAVIVAIGMPTALAAKAATATIPIVFLIGDDPVKHGLVASFNRPAGNVTGLSMLAAGLEAKRLQVLRELLPNLRRIGLVLNPDNPNSATQMSEVRSAAQAAAVEVVIVRARTDGEIEAGFAVLSGAGVGGLLVGADPFFADRRKRIVDVALDQRLPGVYEWRAFAEAGGQASYGSSRSDNFRKVGHYAGKILAGAKPADLPVMQPTKFELVINLKTAKALGLTVPPTLLAQADEVIE